MIGTKITKSTKECLFVPDMHVQQIVQQNREHRLITSRAIAINDALLLSDVSFGTQTDETETNIAVQYIQERTDFEQGWACYPKNKKHTTQMSLESLTMLHSIFTRCNASKCRRYSADRAQALLFEEVAHKDWYEQAFVTESRIKVFFAMSSANQQRLIDAATQQEEATTTVATIVATTVPVELSQDDGVTAIEQLEMAVEAVEREEELTRKEVGEDAEFEQTLNLFSQQS
jgi:hypothetical protein